MPKKKLNSAPQRVAAGTPRNSDKLRLPIPRNCPDDWLASGDWLAAGEKFKSHSPKHTQH